MVRSFFIALQFLTRVQIVSLDEFSQQDFSASTRAYPLVGLVMGTVNVVVFWVALVWLKVPVFPAAVLTTAANIGLTGGLHLDGLMDTADSLFSWRSREKMLEIMKDSRIGANAATALVTVLLLRVSLLTNLWGVLLPCLFLLPVLSRTAVVCLAYAFPHATRQPGLGSGVIGRLSRKHLLAALAQALLCVGVWIVALRLLSSAPSGFWGAQALVLISVTGVVSGLLARTAQGRLGGITGDVLGAAVELSETAALLAAVVVGGVWLS